MRRAVLAADQRKTAKMSPSHAGFELTARSQNEIETHPELIQPTLVRLGKSGGSTPNHQLSLCLGQTHKRASSEFRPCLH
jgi:hypothetical protein